MRERDLSSPAPLKGKKLGGVMLPSQHACHRQKFEAARKDAMKTPRGDFPLGYAEFHLRGSDGADALSIKAYTSTDLYKIVGRLPVNLVFEVHLYCNGVRVGDAIYRRQHTHVEIEQETGACLNLLNGAVRPASLPTNTPP